MNTENWYTKYFNHDILKESYNNNKYIKLYNQRKIKTVKNKVLRMEDTYQKQLQEIKLIYNDPNSLENYEKLTSLEIIKKELEIIKLLSKYSLQNNYLEYDFFVKCIMFTLKLSQILSKRLKQETVKYDNITFNNGIPRCSYKFCNFKDSCIYNYGNNKNICYQDHYVHNMVSADIKVLLEYIHLNYKDKEMILHNKEIQKSINTLSFVIGHMESELKAKCLYLDENEWEKCHLTSCKKGKIYYKIKK